MTRELDGDDRNFLDMVASQHYRHRAEECLASALTAPDGSQLANSLELAMYWLQEAERVESGADHQQPALDAA